MAKFERLTEQIGYSNAEMIGLENAVLEGFLETDKFCCVRNAINRLAAYEDSGLSPERAQELGRADADMRLMVVPELPQDMGDPMEPLKIEAAARSVLMKIDYWKEKDPSKISPLDYTLYACCYHALERMRDELLAKEGKADE